MLYFTFDKGNSTVLVNNVPSALPRKKLVFLHFSTCDSGDTFVINLRIRTGLLSALDGIYGFHSSSWMFCRERRTSSVVCFDNTLYIMKSV
ncbi:hypothetical protein AB6A40_000642 [Gnathostoma spinigerum]|uniref:Uncharacterized protein n=1 Tax=Gnathostoma spinigerum TaxID=75299 RepID=A0ABD6EAZ9_9BILA